MGVAAARTLPIAAPAVLVAGGEGGLWVMSGARELRCVDPGSGDERVRIALSRETQGTPIRAGDVWLAHAGAWWEAADASTGERLWAREEPKLADITVDG